MSLLSARQRVGQPEEGPPEPRRPATMRPVARAPAWRPYSSSGDPHRVLQLTGAAGAGADAADAGARSSGAGAGRSGADDSVEAWVGPVAGQACG